MGRRPRTRGLPSGRTTAPPFTCKATGGVTSPEGSARSGRVDFDESHVPGAVFADHFELADASSPVPMMMPSGAVLARSLGSLGLGDGMTAIIYDRSGGMWAARLWWMLRAIGFEGAA